MSEDAPVEIGQSVRVPKGVTVWDADRVYARSSPDTNKRDQVVGVKNVWVGANASSVLTRDEYEANQRRIRDRAGTGHHNQTQWNAIEGEETLKSVQAALAERHPGKRPILVEWTGKMALLDDCEIVETPARAKKAKAPTLISKLVPNSRWRITRDIDVTYRSVNPAWDTEVERLFESRRPHHTTSAYREFDWAKERERAGREVSKTHPQYLDKPFGTIKAGTVLRCVGKSEKIIVNNDWHSPETYHPYVVEEGEAQVTAQIAHYNGRLPKGSIYFPMKGIDTALEELEIPQVKVWVMRDRETGLFYGATRAYYENKDKPPLEMVPTYAKAKKFKDLGTLKGSVNDFTGYFEGMPHGYGEGRPEWMGDGKKVCDLPPQMEAVAFDKLSKEEIKTVDLQAWHARTWKLRSLTIHHGSIVRKLYNDLDKSGKIDEFSHLCVLAVPLDPDGYYREELTDADKTAFDDLTSQAGLQRGDCRRARDAHSIAFALRDVNTAFLVKMLYRGRLPIAVLNMKTLQEEIREEQAA